MLLLGPKGYFDKCYMRKNGSENPYLIDIS